MSKDKTQEIIELPYDEKTIQRFNLKKYWIVTIKQHMLANNGSPILWHKDIDIELQISKMLKEAKFSEKEIGYKRADRMLKIISKLKVKFTSIIVYGKVENERF